MDPERQRLHQSDQRTCYWQRWGPYLSERQWGTVREDYSPKGDAWQHFPFEHAHLRAYRWGEDGLGGICDRRQRLCFAVALWNGHDPILKERLFGLSGPEGNHGEDVKEVYYYLDNTPTHSYMRYLYRYPQAPFPYAQLRAENRARSRQEPEYELWDTGIFDQGRYTDMTLTYAKASPEDLLIEIQLFNRGPEPAFLAVLPQLWFRNTWSWEDGGERPSLTRHTSGILATHATLGTYTLAWEGSPEVWFTHNETAREALYHVPNDTPYVKDAFHRALIHHQSEAVHPSEGTKAALVYRLTLPPGEAVTLRLRLAQDLPDRPFAHFASQLYTRAQEADQFYAGLCTQQLEPAMATIQRQALAGLLWNKQFYHYAIPEWLRGDPGQPPPPRGRRQGRNATWTHLYAEEIHAMPDKWEYPWFAAWDTAFHAVALSLVDPTFAKQQLDMLTREWYMHPNGQLPAYEWNFSDVNPPVHAWAAWRVYKIERRLWGKSDRAFLERVFQKLLLNFTWWVNQKDHNGNNVFAGGFLGLDNIGIFDRSSPLPTGGNLEQSDGTSWMAMYSLNMLGMALELAQENPVYEDIASKFFEHFLSIAEAMHRMGDDGLWDEQDGFYYDVIELPNGERFPLRVRSMVGLIPLFAVETLEPHVLARFPGFAKRLQWFFNYRPERSLRVLTSQSEMDSPDMRRLFSVLTPRRLVRLLGRMLDESEFLSPYGIRSLSKAHGQEPFRLQVGETPYEVTYDPADSTSGMFGGNSNWRGPVWFPLNFLIIEALQKFHHFFGDTLKVEYPTGSGHELPLWEVAEALEQRLISLFLPSDGIRPADGQHPIFAQPGWREHILFYEYFDGDTGRGLGASHQSGWTSLVAKLIHQWGRYGARGQRP
jgi:hypothetical protein